ncbi:MAG TPA: SGNH/GDSL hydrolase family protein [Terracidiphilus sp.]|nr:SGNH/GDSL hydrolase family protein [Terracidiphilus sp.]
MENPSSILFVGGCHVNGYPVGEENAFTHMALTYLANSGESRLHVLPYSNLHSGPKILAACRELKPDAVVLQLGHYESPSPLRKSLGWKAKKRALAGGLPMRVQSRPGSRYRPTLTMMFAEFQRILAAVCIILSGKRKKMFDARLIGASLDSILAELKRIPLRAIVVLGPFSTPDPLTRFCRRQIVPIFEEVSNKYGCTFVDVFSFLESYPKGGDFRENFADHEHLSVLGHHRVGAVVGAALSKAMGNAPVAENVPVPRTKQDLRTPKPGWVEQPFVTPRSSSVGTA